MKTIAKQTAAVLLLVGMTLARSAGAGGVRGWLDWRGPQQTGVSMETGLPDTWALGGANDLWQIDMSGGGTPVIAGDKLYGLGYQGQGPDLQEVLFCANAKTGKMLWEKRFNDYLSDITYDRYAIGSPAVDAETGNVYAITAAGIFSCYSGDGKLLWQHAMMEQFGRLTFTNGRNGGPFIDDDMVVARGITSNWGGEGPAMDRFYAFDKRSGQLVWSSGSGAPPKDNSFARPFLSWRKGQRVFYTGAGDGSLICINARTGALLWRYPVSAGGFNASVILYKNTLIAIHADENLDSPEIGRMVAVKLDAEPKPAPETNLPTLEKSAEAWHNDLASISSSPVLVGNRIYQVNKTGNLCCVDADTGQVMWRYKLAPDQLHASPLYADGKLYIPMQNGSFYILRPTESGAQELAKVKLAGRCIGAPAVWNGRVYVLTTAKLYCFGKPGDHPTPPPVEEMRPKPGPTVALQIIPSEALMHPGDKVKFKIRGIDANGFVTENFDSAKAKWVKYIPPTAKVKSEMNADFNAQGELVAESSSRPSAGAFLATIGDFKGTIRGRVLPALPLTENFEEFNLTETPPTEPDAKFAYPPLPWIGARFKFDVRDLNGNKVLAKTLDNIFFQRATVFLGNPDAKDYTFEADVMSDGSRRTMSTVGIINQRYLIALQGNGQELEVSSSADRIRVGVPFKWVPKEWYHLKARVDIAPDGSGVVRAKAWKKGDTEPPTWTIEVPHKHAHTNGSPGLFGFAPQSLYKVYIDNISVTPNK